MRKGKIGKQRDPAARCRIVVTMAGDTFNAINQAAAENRRSFSAEAERRLIQSLTTTDNPETADRHNRDTIARMQLEMLGATMGAVFAMTAISRADDRGRSPGYAITDPHVLAEAMASASRIVWAHTMPESDIEALSAELALRLPKF